MIQITELSSDHCVISNTVLNLDIYITETEYLTACNITTGKKTAMGQAEQDPDLPRSTSNVEEISISSNVKEKSHLSLTE